MFYLTIGLYGWLLAGCLVCLTNVQGTFVGLANTNFTRLLADRCRTNITLNIVRSIWFPHKLIDDGVVTINGRLVDAAILSDSFSRRQFKRWSAGLTKVTLQTTCPLAGFWRERHSTAHTVPLADLLTRVAEYLDWQQVVFISDDFEAGGVVIPNDIDECLLDYSLYKIRADYVSRDVANAIDKFTKRQPLKIIVRCQLPCLLEILKQANTYELTADQHGFFTYLYEWIFFTEEESLSKIELSIGNITNVAAIVPNVDMFLRSQDEVNRLLQTSDAIFQLSPYDYYLICGQFCTENSTHFLTKHVAYKIYTAFWKESGRRFQPVGRYLTSGQLQVEFNVFPNKKYHLNGRHLMVATNMWGPFVNKRVVNGTAIYAGFCIEILAALADSLNFSYSLIEPPDGEWGILKNGTFTGLIGQLERKDVDMVVAPITRFATRERVCDFCSVDIFLEYTSVMVRLPGLDDSNIDLFTKPFKRDVWISLLVSIPLASSALAFCTYVYLKFAPKVGQRDANKMAKLQNAVWFSLGAIFKQSYPHKPVGYSSRIIFASWWIVCVVFVTTYGANLIAFLTISKTTLPFNTVEEMVQRDDYTFGTLGGTVWVTSLQNAKSATFQKAWVKIQRFLQSDPTVLSKNHTLLVEKAIRENFAYIVDVSAVRLARDFSTCKVMIIPERFWPLPYSIALQNNSAYRNIIDKQLSWFHATGLMHRWQTKHWPSPIRCKKSQGQRAIGLYQMQGVFYVLFAFLSVSTLVFVSESAWVAFVKMLDGRALSELVKSAMPYIVGELKPPEERR